MKILVGKPLPIVNNLQEIATKKMTKQQKIRQPSMKERIDIAKYELKSAFISKNFEQQVYWFSILQSLTEDATKIWNKINMELNPKWKINFNNY